MSSREEIVAMQLIRFILVLILVHVGSALAGDTFTVIGIGAKSCGQYLEARVGNQEFDKFHIYQTMNWVQGYLSGMNTYRVLAPRNDKKLAFPDHQSIYGYLDKYCREHIG
jgi:hypothetical protein